MEAGSRRKGEYRFTHQYRVVWYELALSAAEPAQWYWKLLKGTEEVNGGVGDSPGDCIARASSCHVAAENTDGLTRVHDFDPESRQYVSRVTEVKS